ncbi:hypothetical protein KIL84_004787 [Mauremys mutica]|uniref:Uncharacterized protein n=1 Tax=Mauremys mutica TaxID=74926 RepID=A0A9D3XQC6_9SAUR|nr:hypothetical protein KIL84_004787 [Mauremys mutica]
MAAQEGQSPAFVISPLLVRRLNPRVEKGPCLLVSRVLSTTGWCYINKYLSLALSRKCKIHYGKPACTNEIIHGWIRWSKDYTGADTVSSQRRRRRRSSWHDACRDLGWGWKLLFG